MKFNFAIVVAVLVSTMLSAQERADPKVESLFSLPDGRFICITVAPADKAGEPTRLRFFLGTGNDMAELDAQEVLRVCGHPFVKTSQGSLFFASCKEARWYPKGNTEGIRLLGQDVTRFFFTQGEASMVIEEK